MSTPAHDGSMRPATGGPLPSLGAWRLEAAVSTAVAWSRRRAPHTRPWWWHACNAAVLAAGGWLVAAATATLAA